MKDNFSKLTALKIKQFRKSQNLTVSGLAKKLNVSHVAVLKWESGETLPQLRRFPQLAKILNCSFSDFFY